MIRVKRDIFIGCNNLIPRGWGQWQSPALSEIYNVHGARRSKKVK